MNLTRRDVLRLLAAALATPYVAACASDEATKGKAFVSNASTADLTATFLKIGKADCCILTTPSSCVVVDTAEAESEDKVVDALTELGVTRIDYLIITHFDQDHVGGAAAVIRNFEVGEVLCSYMAKDSDEVDAYLEAMSEAGLVATEVRDTMSFSLDGVDYEMLPPDKTSYKKDTSNNSSLVTRVTCDRCRLLLTGDIQKERIDELISGGTDLACDLIKVPHHGEWEKNTAALAKAAGARYAVISCSKKNPEDEEVTQAFEGVGSKVLLTRKGDVTAHIGAGGLSVTQD